jgi:FdhD protein
MKNSDPGLASTSVSSATIVRLRAGSSERVEDELAVEEPLEIRLGYTDPRKGRIHRSISITMRTPGADTALALGFLYAESIIVDAATVASVDTGTPNVIRIELGIEASFDPLRLERHFYTTSSCGVCGKASLEVLGTAGFDALADKGFNMPVTTLYGLGTKLREQQTLFRLTGGNHGVALFDHNGEVQALTEDVGRHNAMDKLVGGLLQQGKLPLHQHGILLSGRASFELLQKALAARCPLVVAVGAPSSLAVELAQEFNITLVGFLGTGGCNIYHEGAARLHY